MSDEEKFDYRFKTLPASLKITKKKIANKKKKKKMETVYHTLNKHYSKIEVFRKGNEHVKV